VQKLITPFEKKIRQKINRRS